MIRKKCFRQKLFNIKKYINNFFADDYVNFNFSNGTVQFLLSVLQLVIFFRKKY